MSRRFSGAALRDGEGVFEDGGLMELKKTEEYAEVQRAAPLGRTHGR